MAHPPSTRGRNGERLRPIDASISPTGGLDRVTGVKAQRPSASVAFAKKSRMPQLWR